MVEIQIQEIRKQLPPLTATFTLGAILAVIHLIMLFIYPYKLLIQSPEAINNFAQINYDILNGEIYRLFTAFWIHKDVIHLVSNLLFFFIFAVRLEELTQGFVVILIFIGSGIIGNFATFAFLLLEININSLGASGAVFGLLGALVYLLRGKSKHERRKMYYFIFIFLTITIGQDTNVISHLFGFLGGFTLMKVISSKY